MKEVEALVEQMRKSPYIREKQFGNISSFNFTKKAFYGQHWDELTVRARGLFIDAQEMRIVARGYDKFFELPEDVHCTYPLRVYKKENGFLGLIGWDREKDDFLFCSKSMCNEGPYAEMLRQIFYSSGVDLQAAKDLTKRIGVTIIVEVIDPINDPHIIEYDKPHLVLLDLMFNDLSGKTISYDFMRGWWAKRLNIEPKEFCGHIASEQQLRTVVDMVESVDYTDNGGYVEGYVIHDMGGHMFKLKSGYYAKWKRRRWLVDAILSGKPTNIGQDDLFANWVAIHKKKLLGKSIIEIRKLFYSNNGGNVEKPCGAKMDAKRDDECTDCERDCTMCRVRIEKED